MARKACYVNTLSELKQKTLTVDWFKNHRTEYFILFSKRGFTPELEQIAREEGILLADGFNLPH